MLSRALLATLLFVAPLAAQESLFLHVTDPKTNTRVEAVALFSRPAPGGFLPVRITVNNPADQDGKIGIDTTCSAGGYGDEARLSSSFSLDIPAGKATRHDILVPCNTLLNFGRGDGSISVTTGLSGSFGSESGALSANYSEDQPAILLSEPLYTPNASMLDAGMSSSGSRHMAETFAGKFDPREMPEDWRAFSGYDGIGMTDTDWGVLPPGTRNAILRWNRLGGQLVIYTLSSSSDFSTLGISSSAKGVHEADRSFGDITLVPIEPGLKLDPANTISLFTKPSKLPTLNSSVRSDFTGAWPLKGEFGEQRYNYALFILILVAFGIVVGPVNLFVFAKSGRRHRLFVTTPIIALATSALLVTLIILIDGFGGRGVRISLMEVRPDDGENSAYIFQEQISRTGVLLGGAFTVPEPAAITPVVLDSNQWARLTDQNWGSGMRYEAQLRDGKLEVDGDWFQSRSEQGQLIRAIVPTRGRIEARSTAGPPSFLSTFDFPIETLFYRDDSGGCWRADKIERGKAFTCAEVQPPEMAGFVSNAAASLSARSRKALLRGSGTSLADRKGHFIAVTDAAPAIETLKGIKWQQSRTYITGPIAKP